MYRQKNSHVLVAHGYWSLTKDKIKYIFNKPLIHILSSPFFEKSIFLIVDFNFCI